MSSVRNDGYREIARQIAKKRRRKRLVFNVFDEVMALEIMLDSMHQKALNQHSLNQHLISHLSDYEIELSKMLGMARSALAHLKSGQRTKRRHAKMLEEAR